MAFIKMKLIDLEDNLFRDSKAYVYDEPKIEALVESIVDTSFWENLLARKTKDGRIELAYGHHRKQALLRAVAEGQTQYAEIRINVRSYTQLTDELMLKIFAQENKDDWGENPQNLCMTVLQLKAHLTGLMAASKTKEDLLKLVGAAGSLKMDDRSFTRAKNQGVGATMIAQFLGDTWSRQTIHDALQVLETNPEALKLAKHLPSVTLANRFLKLVTKEKTAKGKSDVMHEDTVQQAVQKEIINKGLTRAEVEAAIKIDDASEGSDPLAAIKTVVEQKKAKTKVAKDLASAGKAPPKEPVEKIQTKFDALYEVIRKEKVNVWPKPEAMAIIEQCYALLREVIDEAPPAAEVEVDDTDSQAVEDALAD